MNRTIANQKDDQQGPSFPVQTETAPPETDHLQIYQVQKYPQDEDKRTRLIRIRDVVNLTNLSKSYIYQLCSQGLFPASVQLVPGGSSVAWVESEVLDWIESRINERDEVANDE